MSISTLASLGMALGAPLVYADQAHSIYRKQDARGFSHDVCAVLLIANITRCFFWLGERFEYALLLQSILMIAAQLGLLYLCIRFRPVGRWSKSISSDGARVVFDNQEERVEGEGSRSAQEDLMDLNEPVKQQEEEEGYANKQPLLVTLGGMLRGGNSSYGQISNDTTLPPPNTAPTNSSIRTRLVSMLSSPSRPLNFWQWSDYNSYLVFLLLLILLLTLLYLLLSWSSTFISILGYLALGLESTLPIPQLISNYRRKSLAGFRSSVLVGWLGGDSFKLLYFVLRGSPVQFTVCAVFQLSVDLAIVAQRAMYREQTEREEAEMRGEQEEQTVGRRREGEVEVDAEQPSRGASATKGKGKGGRAQEEEDGLLQGPTHVISIEADDDDDEGDISNGRK
ncbi:hypothetical protein PSEUBRA_002270 [Kalmanozyma brasiliensis GHG001]|uniref:PQ loop repeat protein n=1 Tax=Kalmanozyma brasiliensis (strain GHG001) TaxID=1365824 RepID=V5EXG5_KALBG|nr:uncharacterized protein PSEUBRA_002270 [Kalmanozyma brasiliensis GHG001]EST08183.1 hypothetical protein PSEUBRA_002270 [Kalmanozyma brasiliensis GHG001]